MQGRELAVGWEEWVDLPCLGRCTFSWLCLLFYVAVSALSSPLLENQPCSSQVPRIPPDSVTPAATGLRGHGLGTRAAATGGGRHHHTECRSPSSRGPVHLGREGEVRTSPWKPWGSAFHSQSSQLGSHLESILFRMVRVHFRNASSTFSPVRALVSRNISSGGGRVAAYSRQSGPQSTVSTQTLTCYLLILSLKPSLRASIHVFFPRPREPSFPRYPPELFLQNSAPISLLQEGLPRMNQVPPLGSH